MSFPLGKWTTVHAPRNADRPPLIDADTGFALSYNELDDRAIRIASALKSRGVHLGDRVGIFSTNNHHTRHQ